MAQTRPDVVVVGAGVIGLTSAICLAEAGAQVLVLTAEPPRETTSAVAGAMIGPSIPDPDPRVGPWCEASDRQFRELARQADTGVHLLRGRLVSNLGDEPPPWAAAVPGFVPCAPAELAGFRTGFWAELPFAYMPRYLDYLAGRLDAAGGRLVPRRITDLGDAASQAPVVVNCTGVGARHLAGDEQVEPIKGQHVVVENPGLDTFLFEGGFDRAWTGFIPHGEVVVLGGVALPGDWDRTPDPAVDAEILARCVRAEPRLSGARVITTVAGLRPGRPAVRLAEERIGDARCIHNYGHGGVGVTLSWGCALDVRGIVLNR